MDYNFTTAYVVLIQLKEQSIIQSDEVLLLRMHLLILQMPLLQISTIDTTQMQVHSTKKESNMKDIMIHGWIMKFQSCEQTFHGLLLQYFHLRGFSKTDPLDFAPTRERFGIASIPPITRIANEFFAHSNTGPQVDFSSNKIWLSKLIGKQKDNYAFLAFAQ